MCSRSWVLYLQSSAFFIAVLAGCVLWQAGSERYGEHLLLQCCCPAAAAITALQLNSATAAIAASVALCS